MRRLVTLLTAASALFLLALVGSCKSVWDDMKADVSGIAKSWDRDFVHAKESVYRHLLNYDENDPYLY